MLQVILRANTHEAQTLPLWETGQVCSFAGFPLVAAIQDGIYVWKLQ